MEPIRLAAYGVALDSGRVLLVRSRENGRWFLPGGGVEPGEDEPHALRREFAEETNLSVEVLGLRQRIEDVTETASGRIRSQRSIYAVRVVAGHLKEEVEGSTDQVAWVALDNALDLPLQPFVKTVLAPLIP